jgi:polyhydroxybutyrate depolymerase
MNRITQITLLLCALLSASWSAAQTIDFGRGPVLVSAPEDYRNATDLPLIVLLHGYTSSGQSITNYWGLGRLVEDYGFVLAAPDGTRESNGNQNPFWNATDACCNFENSPVNDSAYIRHIIDQIKTSHPIDPDRVYVIGHSNGGFMSLRMAYEHSDVIAAVISMAGANHLEQREPPPFPVHVLQIHGSNDETIAFQGGAIREVRYPSARGTVERWADYNGCRRPGVSREMRDLEASLPGYETGVLKFAAGCKPGGSAELWTIAGGTHTPVVSESYGAQLVEWLLAHPKQR